MTTIYYATNRSPYSRYGKALQSDDIPFDVAEELADRKKKDKPYTVCVSGLHWAVFPS
jgi:hypothetical protein